MTRGEVDYADTQGLVRFGYGAMTEASYLLLLVKNVPAARSWLSAAPITSAVEMDTPPSTAMQVAFTAEGLKALDVPASVCAGFSHEFLSGMTEDNRSRRLGDIGTNAPSRWTWGGTGRLPHLVVLLFAKSGRLESLVQSVTGSAWNEAFHLLARLDTGPLDGFEPFGFADGISQPQIDWPQERDPTGAQIHYSNSLALGEVLLGYPNEYGKYTDRPVIDADGTNEVLLPANDAPDRKDVARNGTYLVMRQLQQDVRGFWQFVARQAGGDFAAVDRLAAQMVGRTRAGDPLVPVVQRGDLSVGSKATKNRQNQFTFDGDPMGAACPLGAHVRRANPRNSDFVGQPTGLSRLLARLGLHRQGFLDDLTSSVRFHRVVRRGRHYGPKLSPEEALAAAPPGDPERGLHFICVNANISRQFEFLQSAWTMNTKFSALSGESDPLVGQREPMPGGPVTSDFTLQQDGALRRRVSGIPQFVTVRGGAYFFLPSLRALRYFAQTR
jgi:Dyp-type peroxidase family